jgi:hypothetical protein
MDTNSQSDSPSLFRKRSWSAIDFGASLISTDETLYSYFITSLPSIRDSRKYEYVQPRDRIKEAALMISNAAIGWSSSFRLSGHRLKPELRREINFKRPVKSGI